MSKIKKSDIKFDKNSQEYQYLNLIKNIIENGHEKEVFLTDDVKQEYISENKPFPTIQCLFGERMIFDLSKGEFPLLTTKKVAFNSIVHELLWLISGSSSIKYLVDNKVNIWNEWAFKKYQELNPESKLTEDDYVDKLKNDSRFAQKNSDLGNVYGKQWRAFEGPNGSKSDQLAYVIEGLKTRPYRKSYVVSAWHPSFVYSMCETQNENKRMALPPCHTTFQFDVTDGKLNCALFQRSADMFLGVPFNIASYSLLTLMIAQVTGLEPGKFVHFLGDAHVYSPHLKQALKQLKRKPFYLPSVVLNKKIKNIDNFTYKDIKLENYKSHSVLRAPVVKIGGF